MKSLFRKKSNILILAAIVVLAVVSVWLLLSGEGATVGNAPPSILGEEQVPLTAGTVVTEADAGNVNSSVKPTNNETNGAAESANDSGSGTSGTNLDSNPSNGGNATGTGTQTGSDSQTQSSSDGTQASASDTQMADTQTPSPTQPQTLVCTLSVTCETLVNNPNINPNKASLVPVGGQIFSARSVNFTEGETVYDVLVREMRNNGIHMESVFTPLYNSAYIEGINNLYEFDGGPLSGWMYSVNGWYPNYGCSQYSLSDGDIIQWRYTCDLGNDIGGSGVVQG
jgi:hypothetical protein